MTYEERYEAQFLARGFAMLRDLIARAAMLVGATRAGGLAAHLRQPLLRLLRPGEILLRRMLVVMAFQLTPPSIAPARRGSTGAAPSAPGVPGFSLIEPYPSTTPFHLRRPICRPRPRIRSFDDPVAKETAPQNPLPDPLLSRLAALEAVVSAPDRAALRLARWFARRRNGRRSSPLRIGRPAIGRKHDWAEPISDAQHFAVAALARHPLRCDTS